MPVEAGHADQDRAQVGRRSGESDREVPQPGSGSPSGCAWPGSRRSPAGPSRPTTRASRVVATPPPPTGRTVLVRSPDGLRRGQVWTTYRPAVVAGRNAPGRVGNRSVVIVPNSRRTFLPRGPPEALWISCTFRSAQSCARWLPGEVGVVVAGEHRRRQNSAGRYPCPPGSHPVGVTCP